MSERRRRWGVNRHRVGTIAAVLCLLLLMWDQSYNGRVVVVNSQRAQCERAAATLAGLVNEDRIAQADNANTARTAGVPAGVRRQKDLTVREQEAIIRGIDSRIDRGHWRELDSPVDRRLVRDGEWVGRRFLGAFRCDLAYPAPSPFQFGNTPLNATNPHTGRVQ